MFGEKREEIDAPDRVIAGVKMKNLDYDHDETINEIRQL